MWPTIRVSSTDELKRHMEYCRRQFIERDPLKLALVLDDTKPGTIVRGNPIWEIEFMESLELAHYQIDGTSCHVAI